MDVEKLIEQANRFGMELKRDGGEFEYSIGEKFLDYATALSTLQAENGKLRDENRRWSEATKTLSCAIENLRAELEQVKRENSHLKERLYGMEKD